MHLHKLFTYFLSFNLNTKNFIILHSFMTLTESVEYKMMYLQVVEIPT